MVQRSINNIFVLWAPIKIAIYLSSIQPLGRFSRNQSPVRRPVWLWHVASWQVLRVRLPFLSPHRKHKKCIQYVHVVRAKRNYILGKGKVHRPFLESFTFILALLIESTQYTGTAFVKEKEGHQERYQPSVRNCIKLAQFGMILIRRHSCN